VGTATDYWVLVRFDYNFGMAVEYADGFDHCYGVLVVHVARTGLLLVVAGECYLVVVY
jgi:hypothetical protein